MEKQDNIDNLNGQRLADKLHHILSGPDMDNTERYPDIYQHAYLGTSNVVAPTEAERFAAVTDKLATLTGQPAEELRQLPGEELVRLALSVANDNGIAKPEGSVRLVSSNGRVVPIAY